MAEGQRDRLREALADRYDVQRELGSGGMATVYLAEDLKHHRRVAVKVLRPELAAAMGPERFVREIEIAAQLSHPHILPLYDSGEADGFLYYVMPYVDGESLRDRLAREHELPISEAVRILRDVVDALAKAHAQGVVHRDIKPDNVMLSDRHALVTDFGVAKAVSEATGRQGLTTAGVALGTPTYMAPEQASAETHIDHRADIYAVGALAYELLAGRPPFTAATAQAILAAHITQSPEPITAHRAAVPPALSDLVARCLEKKPADRWQTADELLERLETLATPSGGITPTETRPVTAIRTAPRVALGVAAIIVVALGTWLFVRGGASSEADLDRNRIAVAPFDVLGDELAVWGEGLVDILSRNLDGAGPLRTVSPTIVIRRWSGRADPVSAVALGRGTGAGLVVIGRLIEAGGDSVRVTASIVDVERDRIFGETELRGETARLDQLADSVTVALLDELGRTRSIRAVRGGSVGSRSLPALKHFLQGEQHFRRSNWDSAWASYRRAVELDSTFALAYSRLSLVLGWQTSVFDSLSGRYGLLAGELNHGLSPRDSLLLVTDSITFALAGMEPAGAAHASLVGRLFSTLDAAFAWYPQDPEISYWLGEAEVHYGFFRGDGGSVARGRAAFDRAIALDSAFSPAYIHQPWLASLMRDRRALLAYARAFLAVAGTQDKHGEATRLTLAMLDSAGPEPTYVEAWLDTARAEVLGSAWLNLGFLVDEPHAGLELARLMAAGRAGTRPWSDTAITRGAFLGPMLLMRGHALEAGEWVGRFGRAYADAVLLGGIPAERARATFATWLDERDARAMWALWWWAEQGDTASIAEFIRAQETIFDKPSRAPDIGAAAAPFMQEAAPAYFALARGDTAAALARFVALPDSLCRACGFTHFARARLLAARGRDREVLATLRNAPSDNVTGLWVPWRLERARAHERVGNREQAADEYSWIVAAWRNADPHLQPMVEEARSALARLAAERR